MSPIPVGAKGTYTLRVTPAHLANQFKDAALPPVFATPMMITAMENAALNAVRSYLGPGESAVGTAVNVRHLAATPVSHRVTAEAEVTKVDGRRIEFKVTARDEVELNRLADDLVDVIDKTMQPAQITLWLRPNAPLQD